MADTNSTLHVVVENNTTFALQKVSQSSKELLDYIDKDIFNAIQPLINELYKSEYGVFFTYTIFSIPIANLIAAIVIFLLFLALRKYLTKYVTSVLLYFAKKSDTEVDDMIIRGFKAPLEFLFIIIGIDLFFQLTFIDNTFTQNLLSSMLTIDIFWILYGFTPALNKILHEHANATGTLSHELSNFIVRVVRILIVAIGFIALLYGFGINVTAFVASLGLGGLAFALAARDTAANLFGSIAIMLDQSIKIGEWIKVGGAEGVVEDIGMRTTKIRTFEKSIVVVPNSIVANSNIENFSRRGIRRIKMVIGVTYDTTPIQIQNIVNDIKTMLQNHPEICQDATMLVRFDRFDDSSLGIFVYTFTVTANWADYLRIREDVNIKIMEIVQNNGSSFAFPSQSVYLEKVPEIEYKKDDTATKDI